VIRNMGLSVLSLIDFKYLVSHMALSVSPNNFVARGASV